MFEMYIYTMGDRPYAIQMAKLLDPQEEYFKDKIISRDDGTKKDKKDLDIVLGTENAILILDDKEEETGHMKPSTEKLIAILPLLVPTNIKCKQRKN
ncbi:RNA polymerase II C-terminal domain phosphatase-like 4-like [Trifolium medium]|uniref:protein-serine/threonine phosphatase n=1 Tax=Trifolium medium TaxID=97028 RepID=A0A392MJH9_9FABA|nr:RNA polymerase II C-terminal domain phosphatase-like 4-like [Trifolium medium]